MEYSPECFDMNRPPRKCLGILQLIIWALCFPAFFKHRTEIKKTGVEGLKPPYILLGNHNAFFDMSVSVAATFPYYGNYIVAIDGFIGREWLLRAIGCICKRKFTSDITLIKHLLTVIEHHGIIGLYPEARYSLCGTTAILPESLGKVCKKLNVPVVSLICHGNHINHPFWNTRHERKVVPTKAEMNLLFSKEDLKNLSVDEINSKIVKAFQYDDFKWQADNHIKVACKDRAVGLEKILYQCPHCGKEYEMVSEGTTIKCSSCGKTWTMDEYGRLSADSGETEFSHIPAWYEWERENVRKEVEAGTYNSGVLPVTVEHLPNAKKFIPIGKGTMVHDMNGFSVTVTDEDGTVRKMEKDIPSLYSCHVEYEYLFKHGDCIDLNTLEDTWYIYPYDKPFSVTKMALATEELYLANKKQAGKLCKPGLA